MDRHFVTPSGSTVHLRTGELRQAENRDAKVIEFEVTSSGVSQRGRVLFDAIPHMSALLKQDHGQSFTPETATRIAPVAILTAVDEDPEMFRSSEQEITFEIGPGNLYSVLRRPRLSDRELRRYIARSLYDGYARSDMDVLIQFDDHDRMLTGSSSRDFLRSSQVLEGEGYLVLHRTMGDNFQAQPTARLVRDVERYGSARDDAISSEDYVRVIGANPVLVDWREAVLLEYGRYSTAVSQVELESVFRAIAPIVEDVLRQVLRGRGVEKEMPTLGPMIAEMQSRGMGDVHLYSQLNHVLKFARDLEQHGASLPESVLRIAAANAFELLPQIAGLVLVERGSGA